MLEKEILAVQDTRFFYVIRQMISMHDKNKP